MAVRNSIAPTNIRKTKTRLAELSVPRIWWLVATAIAAAIVLGMGALTVVRALSAPISVLILGFTLAAALEPLVARLEQRLPRLLAVAVVYAVLAMLLAGVLWAVVPSVWNQLQGFGTGIPDIAARARQLLPPAIGNLFGDSLTNALKSQLTGGKPGAPLSVPMAITAGLADIIAMLFVSIYTLLGKSGMREFVLSLLPKARRPRVREVMGSMADAMGGYVRGALVNGVIMGVLTAIGLLILGVRFALVLGLLTGLLEIVPVIGPILAGAIIVAFTLLQDPARAVVALIFMIALQQLEGHILVPNIMRSQSDISPVLAIVAVLAGAEVGGLLGVAVSLPIAAALTVLVREVIAPAIRKQTGAGELADST